MPVPVPDRSYFSQTRPGPCPIFKKTGMPVPDPCPIQYPRACPRVLKSGQNSVAHYCSFPSIISKYELWSYCPINCFCIYWLKLVMVPGTGMPVPVPARSYFSQTRPGPCPIFKKRACPCPARARFSNTRYYPCPIYQNRACPCPTRAR